MLVVKKMDAKELKEAASFIAQVNQIEEHHIGYCGTDANEIRKSLAEDLTDVPFTESFVTAYWNEELIGVLGFDVATDDQSAETWGPFVKGYDFRVAQNMWEHLIESLPNEIQTLAMFPNQKNTRAIQFAQELQFVKKSEQAILTFHRNDCCKLKEAKQHKLTEAFEEQMIELHDRIFPGTYYSGKTIVDRQNEERQVFILTEGTRLIGYIYVEAEPEFGEGSIEFFAVDEGERGKGIGEQLLAIALRWLFTFPTIEEITLCVNASNDRAIRLYQKVGFRLEHELSYFSKTRL
ncbi:GNAT family N-acetyltransferase [Cytobacillus spongiae]|uniref:GNAT family N-acetyltransferase n=1 Tax=Cytobacillus spongiae TaxID=2901381 RepID=UPI001F170EDD|nr:GNAT family N-acetyltransferase [Cytobacillus spongiae]UII57573.1 GNAT family N-acetyltransferase [Cytobacillus spongiae]